MEKVTRIDTLAQATPTDMLTEVLRDGARRMLAEAEIGRAHV